MKITTSVLGAITVLLGLTAAISVAEGGQAGASSYAGDRHHHYGSHARGPEGHYGWRGLRLFGFGYDGGRCDRFLRQAIQIDTPDPRYWNRYDACIGL
jgi:hypothetical protein